MAMAAQTTSNADNYSSKADLIQETFYETLDTLRQLGLYRRSPKLFVIYAHDNHSSESEANQEIVKDYITWFKKILVNVDSDKSPHGFGPLHESAHPGASFDIITNQVCLLPTSWHEHNVDYVLIFYSKLLASHMKTERRFEHPDGTYSQALDNALDKYKRESQVPWKEVCDTIRTIQGTYSNVMDTEFHHVLTEMALVSLRNQCSSVNYTIPILLYGDDAWDEGLKWKPSFVGTKDTQIRIYIARKEEYQQFFKILLEFETLETDRELIEAMSNCFKDSIKQLEENLPSETYRKNLQIRICQALREMRNPWDYTSGRPINSGNIRDILNRHTRLNDSFIQGVSGNILPANSHDIDIVVAGDSAVGTVSVDNRQAVPLHSLFDERVLEKDKKIRPQRILIHGKPGIGKTTLCRRLMHDYSLLNALMHKFALVVRIPARKLESYSDLEKLLFNEYFRAIPRGHELSSELGNLILTRESASSANKNATLGNILIILDGLDEASNQLQETESLLKKLMKQLWIVITSRSYNIDKLGVSADLQLEAIGLSSAGVSAYLHNKEVITGDAATEVQQLIKSNAFIMDMIKVPIHLDILCYSWDQLQEEQATNLAITDEGKHVIPTMTALYHSVVRSLWRKDIPILEKLDHGELVTERRIKFVRDAARLERLVGPEIKLLEEIALEMMETDRLDITDKDVAEVIRRLESNGKSEQIPLSVEGNLQKLSLLPSDFRERYWNYRFVHPTFQEFFSARCLVRDHNRLRSHLKRHKYNRRFENVWRFTSGLLSSVEELDLFFNILDDEPRDLVGMQHSSLIMYCLSECRKIRPSRWDDLQERLGSWLNLECDRNGRSELGTHMEFPESILQKELFLRAGSVETHEEFKPWIRTVNSRASLSKGFVHFIIQLAEDKAWALKCNTNIDEESQIHPISLLTADTGSKFACIGPELAFDLLCSQDKLNGEIYQALHNFIHATGHYTYSDNFNKIWGDRHVEQFCKNQELLNWHRVSLILSKMLIPRGSRSSTPAYIDGDTLYFNAADGNLIHQRLENEAAFRKKFMEAQRMANYPEWAWIKQCDKRPFAKAKLEGRRNKRSSTGIKSVERLHTSPVK